MTKFDWAVLAVLVVVAVFGAGRGLLRTLLPVVGAVVGLAISAAFSARLLVSLTSPDNVKARTYLLYVAFLGVPLLGAVVGAMVASRISVDTPTPASRMVGAIAAVAVVLGLAWFVAPMSKHQLAYQTASVGSTTAELINKLPYPPGPHLDDLIAEGALPAHLGDLLGHEPDEPAPTTMPANSGAAQSAVRAATVQLYEQQCATNGAGSGFAVQPDLIVTNAHVVAGATSTEVVTIDGQHAVGRVVLFDPARDLALVRVPGLSLPALPLAPTPGGVGTIAITAGHPAADPTLHVAPARIDALGFFGPADQPEGVRTVRHLYRLSTTDVQRGSSGGPLVDVDGRVLGVVFAVQEGQGTAYAVAVDELHQIVDRASADAVATGAGC